MDTPATLERIAAIIPLAPGWTRVGITAPDPRVRARATYAFAAFISEQLDAANPPASDPGQLPLPMRF